MDSEIFLTPATVCTDQIKVINISLLGIWILLAPLKKAYILIIQPN